MNYRKHAVIPCALFLFLSLVSNAEAKKNVILIIPDGCSSVMWAAIRAMTVGTDNLLNVDRLPVQGRCRTYSADALITDSAAGGTAYACGVKTNNGVLGMSASTTLGDSLSGKPVPTILELAEKAGYVTGLISTAYLQHATPAAFYSHKAHRDWYDLIAGDLPESGIEVLMGGGRQYMTPRDTMDEEGALSKRTDRRNIIDEMKRKGYTYIYDTNGFRSLDTKSAGKVLGLFNPGHMEYELHRAKDKAGEPALWEMTEKALEILSRNKKGFFLMVEAAKIDHAAHVHQTAEYLWDGIAADKTIGVAMEFARKNKNTLLIVVPDHGTGGPHLVGMHDLSKPDSTVIDDGFPHYRLNGVGFPVDDGGRPVAIQWVKGTGHTGEDVTVSAYGPNAGDLDGVIQNIDVFRVMARHLGVDKLKNKQRRDAGETIDF
jgi:alkaline phosphatase